ncbi:hypothetical protein QUB56_16005 [Microcoleus sp. AR_TQ3_B6]|uniref:hypothetical protein n=1 Tax=Microcoleus sp. AR_TQ3_B6 TaxID=3055284 RepID=UPI002FD59ACC
MSDIKFWKPACQLFRPDEPLINKELEDFYVRREDSPVDDLVNSLATDDEPSQYLVAGHRGGGKTTELRRLEQKCTQDYTVVWVDTDTALDKFNIGHAEVPVLIGMQVVQRLKDVGWKLPQKLEKELLETLKKITYQDKVTGGGELQLPKLFQDLGMLLKVGFQRETTRTLEVKPVLGEIINKVNEIIAAAQRDKPKLLVIVDGLDRKEYSIAQNMFSSSLLTDLQCHICYAIPIDLRYSPSFRQTMEGFTRCLDLSNIAVFKCDEMARPTTNPDRVGRHILMEVVQKRLATLGDAYANLFEPQAMDLLCEKSGGVLRDLVRLARMACQVALSRRVSRIDRTIAEEAVREEHRMYTIEDYHFPELETVHRTGKLSSNVFDSPKHGRIVICNELLHYKLVLGYDDKKYGRWFDVNPMLWVDLERWQQAKE